MKTLIKMQFDPEIAKKVGVGEAIMYANIEYWCGRNELNNKNFHDGHYWTYNSKNAFTELFPFWTERQIRTILDNLRKKGYIKTGNYNKVKYDKTLWYTIIMPKGADGRTDKSNRADQTDRPIPNDKPNNKPSLQPNGCGDKNSHNKKQQNSSSSFEGRELGKIASLFRPAEYFEELLKSEQEHVKIVGWYMRAKGMDRIGILPTKQAAEMEMKRNLRVASRIVKMGGLKRAVITAKKIAVKFDAWTLETVEKQINLF